MSKDQITAWLTVVPTNWKECRLPGFNNIAVASYNSTLGGKLFLYKGQGDVIKKVYTQEEMTKVLHDLVVREQIRRLCI